MNSLWEAPLFVVESGGGAQFLRHRQLLSAPRGDDGNCAEQTGQLNSGGSDSAGTGVDQHHLPLLHLSCDDKRSAQLSLKLNKREAVIVRVFMNN